MMIWLRENFSSLVQDKPKKKKKTSRSSALKDNSVLLKDETKCNYQHVYYSTEFRQ